MLLLTVLLLLLLELLLVLFFAVSELELASFTSFLFSFNLSVFFSLALLDSLSDSLLTSLSSFILLLDTFLSVQLINPNDKTKTNIIAYIRFNITPPVIFNT
ncbi:hypothetical protein FDB15_16620 [Clostridium botulinum]|nr:hypothetical protein [Clostridium botulinum]NFF36792.1 hypothetical protein [Clostridium botulinum]NFH74073.1 hypothetical protein [Clostridium botulinum]NFI02222.1 hypothetical protein [Clostridium botulinum]NFI51178.1 hypothetical protein [Clostridium botulinum]